SPLRVLVVEPDDEAFERLCLHARRLDGWTLVRAPICGEREHELDACLLGLDAGRAVLEAFAFDGPVVGLSSAPERGLVGEAMAAGAHDVLDWRTLDAASLDRSVRFAVAQHRLASAQRASAEAAAAVRMTTELVATLSDELRAPLGAMRASVGALADASLSNDERECARALVARSVGVVERTVEDLLDLARAQRGELVVARTPLPLADVLRRAVESIGVDVSWSVADVATIEGDAHRLEQMFDVFLECLARWAPDARWELRLVSAPSEVEVVLVGRSTVLTAELVRAAVLPESSARPLTTRAGERELALARAIASAHGARLFVDGEPPEIALRVTFPACVAETSTPRGNAPARQAGE
ncbi:MAG: HAMP domain-containing histidine kinase, partial [Myxococcales bacterium]|nr:HAMP domain-containing histidine kinase [Myxococcales bacterium]